jgi:NADH:ubiquinone oxidoreductase subunit D
MHAAFIIPGGVSRVLTDVICKDILIFTQQFKFRLIELEELLSANRI